MLKEYNWEIFLSEKLKEEYVEKKNRQRYYRYCR